MTFAYFTLAVALLIEVVGAYYSITGLAAIFSGAVIPILIMGGGTNVLISDKGFEGTVIRISNNSVQAEVDACSGATLTIGAGEDWDSFVQTTIDRGFAGLETLAQYAIWSKSVFLDGTFIP